MGKRKEEEAKKAEEEAKRLKLEEEEKKRKEEEERKKAEEEEAKRLKLEEERKRKEEEENQRIKAEEEEAKKKEEEEQRKKIETEVVVNPKGKSNSWSRSKSVEMQFDLYEDDGVKTKDLKFEKPSKENTYPAPPKGYVYIRSPTSKWRECEITEVLEDGKKWKIHYKDFSTKYDEIVDADCDRITTTKPEVVVPKKKKKKKMVEKKEEEEDRIWVESGSKPNIHRES